MTPKRVFISHGLADDPVVPLLDRLIALHGDEPWHAKCDLRRGDPFREKIQQELMRADTLVVVVSRGASRSPWVAAEVARFRALKPEALVIPLVLDDFPKADLGRISPELVGIPAICCTPGLLEGFRDLFAALGRDFLSQSELRDRRQAQPRRQGKDRRMTHALQRLSVGLLITYTRETGQDLSEATHLSVADLDALRPTVLRELSRYVFHDRGQRIDVSPELVLDAALHQVRTSLIRHGATDAVQALRMVAAYIGEQYQVSMIERRERGRRPEAASA